MSVRMKLLGGVEWDIALVVGFAIFITLLTGAAIARLLPPHLWLAYLHGGWVMQADGVLRYVW